jgi:hypothetical protein
MYVTKNYLKNQHKDTKSQRQISFLKLMHSIVRSKALNTSKIKDFVSFFVPLCLRVKFIFEMTSEVKFPKI